MVMKKDISPIYHTMKKHLPLLSLALAFLCSLPSYAQSRATAINWASYGKTIDKVLTTITTADGTTSITHVDANNNTVSGADYIVLQSATDGKIVTPAGIYGAEATLTTAGDIMYVQQTGTDDAPTYQFRSMQDQNGASSLASLDANKLTAARGDYPVLVGSALVNCYLDRAGGDADLVNWKVKKVSDTEGDNSYYLYMSWIKCVADGWTPITSWEVTTEGTENSTSTVTVGHPQETTNVTYTWNNETHTDVTLQEFFDTYQLDSDNDSKILIRYRKNYVYYNTEDTYYLISSTDASNFLTIDADTGLASLNTTVVGDAIDLSTLATVEYYLSRLDSDGSADGRSNVLTLREGTTDAEQWLFIDSEARQAAIESQAGQDEIDMTAYVLDNAFLRNHFYTNNWKFTTEDYKDATTQQQMYNVETKWLDQTNNTLSDSYSSGLIPVPAIQSPNGTYYNASGTNGDQIGAANRPLHSVSFDSHARDRTYDWGSYAGAEIDGETNTMSQTITSLPVGSYKIVFQGVKVGGEAKFFANGSDDQGTVSVALTEMADSDKTAFEQYKADIRKNFYSFDYSVTADELAQMSAADTASLNAYIKANSEYWGLEYVANRYYYSQYDCGYVRDNTAAAKVFANTSYASDHGDWVNDDYSKYSTTLQVNVEDDNQDDGYGSLLLGLEKTTTDGQAFVDNIQVYYMGNTCFHIDATAALDDGAETGTTAAANYEWRNGDFDNTLMYYRRALTSGAWNAITLPVDLTAKQVKQLAGDNAKLSILDGVDENGTVIVFEPIDLSDETKTVLKKDSCYVLYMDPNRTPDVPQGSKAIYRDGGTTDNAYFINGPAYMITGVTQEAYTNTSVTSTGKYINCNSANGKINYTAYYLLKTGGIPQYSYVQLQGKMYYLTSSTAASKGYVEGTSWYLLDDEGEISETAKTFVFDGIIDSEATAIESIDISTDTTVAERRVRKGIYNLQGQRVSTPMKGGIYIIDGKKVIY